MDSETRTVCTVRARRRARENLLNHYYLRPRRPGRRFGWFAFLTRNERHADRREDDSGDVAVAETLSFGAVGTPISPNDDSPLHANGTRVYRSAN